MAPAVEEYIIQLIMGTREPGHYDSELAAWLEYGASPRATIALDRCARANAWIAGRDYVSPDDVHVVRADIIAPCYPGVGTGTSVQGDRRARARPILQPSR